MLEFLFELVADVVGEAILEFACGLFGKMIPERLEYGASPLGLSLTSADMYKTSTGITRTKEVA